MNLLIPLLVFTGGEIIAFVVFLVLNKKLGPKSDGTINVGAIAKGVLERLVLFTGLSNGFPQIIIAFGAFKLGTRLHDENGPGISNNYFLVGNLVSLLLAMLYTMANAHLLDG